jgi:uncharacterized membrane protein
MAQRLRIVLTSLTTTLWFVPLVMSLFAGALALLALKVDLEIDGAWWLHRGSASDASALLSSLLNSLMTISALVVSITVVVLTLAARQLGPRILLSFMGDVRTQLALGYFISTVVYFLLVLRVINSSLEQGDVPHLAVTIGSVLMLGALLTLIFYTHHLARAIVTDTVISRIGCDFEEAICRHFPEPLQVQSSAAISPPDGPPAVHRFSKSGYVQTINYEGLGAEAEKRRAYLKLSARPGKHVLAGAVQALVWPRQAFNSDFGKAITDAVALGDVQAADQDVEFAARQLVEMTLRALSSGNADPYTAIAIINRISKALVQAIRRDEPQYKWPPEDAAGHLVAPAISFSDLLHVLFDEIRTAAALYPIVVRHIFDQLLALHDLCRTDAQRQAVGNQIQALLESDSPTVQRCRTVWLDRIRAHKAGERPALSQFEYTKSASHP